MFKTKLRKSDSLFRRYALKVYGYTCARCRRTYPSDNCRGLHVSHYWGRGRENTRHDIENVCLLCYGCHLRWGHGDQREQYTGERRQRLGDKGFDLLELRAYTYKKRDDKLDEIIIKELLKEVNDTA